MTLLMGETEVPKFLQLGTHFVKDCIVGVAMHRGYALSSRIEQLISRVVRAGSLRQAGCHPAHNVLRARGAADGWISLLHVNPLFHAWHQFGFWSGGSNPSRSACKRCNLSMPALNASTRPAFFISLRVCANCWML